MGTDKRIKGLVVLASVVTMGAAGCGAEPGGASAGEPAAAETGIESVSSGVNAYLGPVMTINVHTGADNLRGSSSVAWISVLRADGRWSSERAFSKDDGYGHFTDLLDLTQGRNELPSDSNWQYTLGSQVAGWDGFDPCAKSVRVRLQQGSCFLCGEDYWSMRSLTLDFREGALAGSPGSWRMATTGSYKLGGSMPSVTATATQTPAGEVCANGAIADCNGLTALTPPDSEQWDTDTYCDDGTYGAFLVCSAFKFDSGQCGGPPPSWSCPAAFYGTGDGCDCECSAWDPDCNVAGQTLFGCSGSHMACQNSKQAPGVFAPACVPDTVVR